VQTGVSLVSAGYDVPHAKTFLEELIARVDTAPSLAAGRAAVHLALVGVRSLLRKPARFPLVIF
jgi:hypothetical protein